MKDFMEFYKARTEALEKELKKAHATIQEMSEVSTKHAAHLKVIISDPNFDKPLNQLEKKYEN